MGWVEGRKGKGRKGEKGGKQASKGSSQKSATSELAIFGSAFARKGSSLRIMSEEAIGTLF